MDQDPPQARTTNPRDTRTGPCPSHTAMDTAASRPSYGRRRPVGQNPFTESKPYAEPGSHAADQAMGGLVVFEILAAQAADRDQAVGAGLIQGDEQAKAGHTVDPAGEAGADPPILRRV